MLHVALVELSEDIAVSLLTCPTALGHFVVDSIFIPLNVGGWRLVPIVKPDCVKKLVHAGSSNLVIWCCLVDTQVHGGIVGIVVGSDGRLGVKFRVGAQLGIHGDGGPDGAMLRRLELEANIGVLFEFLSMLLHLGLELRGAIDKGCGDYLAAFPLKAGYGDGVDMFALRLFSFVVIWGGGCAHCVASVFRVLHPAVATWTRAEEDGNGKIYCDLDDGRPLITSLIGHQANRSTERHD